MPETCREGEDVGGGAGGFGGGGGVGGRPALCGVIGGGGGGAFRYAELLNKGLEEIEEVSETPE